MADHRGSWGVVADDLTGAADAGVQFVRVGLPVSVHLALPTEDGKDRASERVDVVVTEARHLDDAAAERVTADAVTWLVRGAAERVYLKVDSAGRGSIRAQVTGGLRALRAHRGDARALVCPAYPALGRTVVNGLVRVDGVPTTSSPAAGDPIAPPVTADLRTLWPADDVDVVDASDDEQLAMIARRVLHAPELLAVGSAGLLGRLAEASGAADRGTGAASAADDIPGVIVVASSSLHPTAQRQIDALIAAALPAMIVVAGPAERVTPEEAVADLAERAAAAVAAARAAGPVAALVLVGGDGALASLRRLGAHRIDLDGSISEGIPTGIVIGGDADGLRVVTKSGGFGVAETLVDLVDSLHRLTPTKPTAPGLSTP